MLSEKYLLPEKKYPEEEVIQVTCTPICPPSTSELDVWRGAMEVSLKSLS
jgi:hypothetical protein